MDSPGTFIFLALFGLSTALTYLALRRGWTRTLPGSLIGAVVNSFWLILYSLAKGNMPLQAILVGALFGVFFTALTVSIALFFRNNPPGGVRT
jgi:hypothetical protein